MQAAKETQKPSATRTEIVTPESKAMLIARNGITNSHQFVKCMSALMTDLIEGAITPGIGNAMCNAGGKMLKCIELQYKYGRPTGDQKQPKVLSLCESDCVNV